MDILIRLKNDSELMLIAKQLAFGGALCVAFMTLVYIGGALAHLVSGF